MTAALFLIQTLFGFYILAVLLRFLLQWVRADFYNPLVQFLVKLTNPPLIPLRRIIPGFMGLDMAAVVLMIGLKIDELLLVLSVLGQSPNFVSLLLLALIELCIC
ncbi:MAG: YggT family protein [Candidatus Competibacteraceae bacterium]